MSTRFVSGSKCFRLGCVYMNSETLPSRPNCLTVWYRFILQVSCKGYVIAKSIHHSVEWLAGKHKQRLIMDYYNVRKLITVLLLFLCAFAMYLFLTSTPQMRQSYIDRLWMIQGNRPVVKDWYTQAEMDRYNNGWRIQDDPNFVNYIRKKWLDYPSRRKVNVPDKDYSQFGEKATIDRLLDGKRNGFFFEVGALDGQLYSNTLNLEVSMNWTGILVEPDPINYGNLRKLNRNSYSLNVCLSPNQSAILPFLMNSAMSTLVKTNRYDV